MGHHLVKIKSMEGTKTGFIHHLPGGGFNLHIHNGDFTAEPEGFDKLYCVNKYSSKMAIKSRQNFEHGKITNEFEYEYEPTNDASRKRLSKFGETKCPIIRKAIGDHEEIVSFNRNGLIEAGSYIKDGNLIRFQYHYGRVTQFGGELLRAEFVLPHLSCTVSWCTPPIDNPEKRDTWVCEF
jgi:hypothetical protein